ncbi:MAG TPA: sigma-54 dependent transcriptional regulator [Terriglobales bacterium]|nr:sigma-54 dependent transcriptional regulator [Terriglobales bacterium]
MKRVLIADDDAGVRAGLEVNFRRQGWSVATAAGVEEALTKFRQAPCPLVVTDMRMPDGDGMKVIAGVRQSAPNTAIVLLTAFANVPDAVQAMRAGACDYLMKPASFSQLLAAAERVMAGAPDKTEPRDGGTELVGDSAAIARLRETIGQIAATEADILVEAESGTGKELVARAIHAASRRRAKPFVAVNCAALPEHLLESELFGYVRGAFSGADRSKAGKFELANGGTLLLDEIGEMALELQPKLLRALQEREVDPLGGTTPVAVDVRVIATTNRALQALVESGQFRADLYYRLNVVPLRLPPLRERREDIPALASHFLRKHGGEFIELTPELLRALAQRAWPGNVRELENFVRRALALARGPRIGLEALEEEPRPAPPSAAPGLQPGVSWREAERKLLEATLAATGGNRTRAATMLGMSLRTIRNKIREYQLPPRSYA